MAQKSSMEWTDASWNPVTGCTKVSTGCKHCYAETLAKRFWGDRKFTDVRLHPERIDQPLRWRKPRMIFVNSMSDLFHEDVPHDFIDRVFAVMYECQRHTFQVLTKRPERMAAYFNGDLNRTLERIACRAWLRLQRRDPETADLVTLRGIITDLKSMWPLPNVWLGTSVENQETADKRIPCLLTIPAAVLFVSYEPALGPVDFNALDILIPSDGVPSLFPKSPPIRARGHALQSPYYPPNQGRILDWVIVGGESGPGARPFDIDWARSTIKQCHEAGVPCFVKQLGSQPFHVEFDGSGPFGNGWPQEHWMRRLRDADDEYVLSDWQLKNRKGADPGEWPEDLRVQEFPAAHAALQTQRVES